jgi:hypothetical protein|eukprot:459297-Prymnesium_polylepis.1
MGRCLRRRGFWHRAAVEEVARDVLHDAHRLAVGHRLCSHSYHHRSGRASFGEGLILKVNVNENVKVNGEGVKAAPKRNAKNTQLPNMAVRPRAHTERMRSSVP